MLPFLLLNILVSAAVVLLILNWWERRQVAGAEDALATVQITRPVLDQGVPATAPAENPPPEATSVTLTSDNGETIYIVQPGDILSNIALQFDVPVADIVTANNLTNPDQLFVGQELVIPVGGLAATEPTAIPVTEATPEPVDNSSAPTATAGTIVEPQPTATDELTPGVVIVQITEVIGVGDLADEAVSIANFGDRQVGLQGWTLSDQEGRIYTFGQVTLFGEGAAILVHTETGQDSASDLFWGLEEAVWSSGETVTLTNAEGTIEATFVIP
jgi:LysM repeat protein